MASFEDESFSESEDSDDSSSDAESVCSSTSSHGGGDQQSTVYVGAGLPEHTTEQHIRSHFSQFSSYIVSVQMIRDHQTKKFKGFAFVKFSSADTAEMAITCLNQTKLLGRTLRVSQHKKATAMPKEREQKRERSKVKPVKVSATGFPSSVLDSALRSHFASCNLLRVKRPRHKQGKNYRVLLLFPDLGSATRAVRCLNNSKLLDQYPLRLQLISREEKGKKKRERKRGGKKSPPGPMPKSSVLVTNIAPTIDTDDIKSLFGKCGNIVSCSYTTPNKREVEIAFSTSTGAQLAIEEFNGMLFLGRKLRVVLPAAGSGGAAAAPSPAVKPQNKPAAHPLPGHLPPAGRGRGTPKLGQGHHPPPAARGYHPPPAAQGHPPPAAHGHPPPAARGHHPPPAARGHHLPAHPTPQAPLLATPTPGLPLAFPRFPQTPPPAYPPPVPTAYPSQPPVPTANHQIPPPVPSAYPPTPPVPMAYHQTPPPPVPSAYPPPTPPPVPSAYPPTPSVPSAYPPTPSVPSAYPPTPSVPSAYPPPTPPVPSAYPPPTPPVPSAYPPTPPVPSAYPPPTPPPVPSTYPPPTPPPVPSAYPPPTPPPVPSAYPPTPSVPSAYPSHPVSTAQLTWSRPISVDLYQFVQEHASKEIDTFIGRGGSIDHQNSQLFIRAGDISEVDQFSKFVMDRYSERQLACSPDQWNALVMAGPTGVRKVDELRSPFASNPSVLILEKTLPHLHILFVGLKDAMLGAYNHFCGSLNKELPVDRLTLLTLVELKCDLATKISEQYTVQIDGYHRESTKLYFTGTTDNVVLAKKDMETHIACVCKSFLSTTLSPQLVSLATLFFSKPGAKGVLLTTDSGAKCVYCCSQEELAECEKLIAKPSTSTISVEDLSTIDIEALKSKVDCNTVAVSLKEKAIVIEGFEKKQVRQARRVLQQEVEVTAVEPEPASQALLPCTLVQRLYLHNLLERMPEGEMLKQSLPVTVSCDKDGIYIMGIAQDRETSSHTLLEKVPPHHRYVAFSCHKSVYSVIEKHILQPSGTVEWVRDDWDSKPSGFKVVLYSRKVKQIERVHKNLKEISPVSKWFTTISKSKNALTSAQDAIESKYRCSLNIRPEEKGQLKVAINALTEEEALAAKEGLYKLTMSDRDKYIRMSGLAMKFLLVKHEEVLKQLKQSCQEFHYPPFLRKRKASEIVDPVSIKVVGNAHDKQGADDTIKFLLGSFSECRFDVNFNSSLQLNQLEQLRQIYEEKNNMLIEIQHDPAGFKVSFVIYGPDKEGMQEFKSLLEEMSGSQYGRSSSQDHSDIKSEAVSLPAKKSATFVSEICSSNPVVNLVFSPSCNLDFHKQTQFLARKEQVSLLWKKKQPPCLSLKGTEKDVALVKQKIEQVLIPEIEEMLGGAQLMVHPLLLPAMSERFCQRLNNQLMEELCVIATFPRLQKTNTLLKKVSFVPSQTSPLVTVVVNKGSIIYEPCDAAVVPASCDLRHSSGLAKIVSEVGGPMLQSECTDYVEQNGPLQPGAAVALGAGFLPCMNLIYTVVPQWYGGNEGAKNDIYTVVQECLKTADHIAVSSVAFPPINCGDLLRTPEPVVAAASLTAVRNYLQMNPTSTIDTVVFALDHLAEQEAFLSALSDVFGDCSTPPTSPSKASFPPPPPPAAASYQPARPVPIPARPAPPPPPPLADSPPRPDSPPVQSSPAAALFNAVTKKIPGLSKLSSIVNFEFLSKRNIPSKRDVPPTMPSPPRRPSAPTTVQPPPHIGTVEQAEPMIPSMQWSWANDHGFYSPYCNEVSILLTHEYRSDPRGSAVFLANNTTYWLDFNTMMQTNVDTGYKRKVSCRPFSASEPQMQWEIVDKESSTKPTSQRQAPAESDEQTHCVKLYGPEENLEPASKWIGRQLDSRVKTDTLSLPVRLSQKQEENLQRIASKHHVEMQINDTSQGSRQKILEIRGVDYKVEKAMADMEQAISHGNNSGSSDNLPPWWVAHTPNVVLHVFGVVRGSAEWKHVELKFYSTITQERIKSIVRIQNKWLWKRYTQHRTMLKEKNNGLVNEMDLFHGTGDTPPMKIYDSEEGFDMRFSAQGMWGQANYFAVNASYSNSYAHQNSRGDKEIFLAKVLTGDNYSCRSDRSLRMPPLKGSSSSGVQLGQVRYDTVTGTTGGSQVYMTYDNQKAYPAYLITY